jgi:hypothetical protein
VAALWCEAETHREMLAPVAAAFRVALVVTRGSPSLSLLHTCARAIERRYREGQTTRIVYVGDHDPAGLDMSRRLHERLCELHMPVEACTVERVAVTTIAIVRWALASVIADQEAWEGHEAHDRAEQRRLRAFIREHESEIDSEDDDPDGDEDGEWLGIPH